VLPYVGVYYFECALKERLVLSIELLKLCGFIEIVQYGCLKQIHSFGSGRVY
jgi:hypothetical protein